MFEAKQEIYAAQVRYAHKNIASVRRLHRTSLPIRTINGLAAAKEPDPIIGGILTLDSGWANPALGEPLRAVLAEADGLQRLDIGCAASHGLFTDNGADVSIRLGNKAATAFLFELMTMLQRVATVGMIGGRLWSLARGRACARSAPSLTG